MIRRRLATFLVALTCAGGLTLTGHAPGDGGALLGPVPPVSAAGGGCEVTTGAGGGTVTACPDAAGYEDVATGLGGAFASLRSSGATGPLEVVSEPAGAIVQVNGIEAGTTPLRTTLTPGSYVVRIAAEGYAPYSTSVAVGRGEPGAVRATLTPVAGGAGSYQWVRAKDLIALVDGFPEGEFSVSHFARDRDGAYWIVFVNSGDQTTELERPPNPPAWFNVPTTIHTRINVTGLATSADGGRSWRVVQSWRDTFSARGWTSDEFHDRKWDPEANGFPSSFKDHVLRAYYTERRVDEYYVWNLIPRQDGGVNVLLWSRHAHLPQELGMAWDNAGTLNFPGEFIGELVADQAPGGTYASVAADEAKSKWGAGGDDFATYNWIEDGGDTVVSSTGGESPVTFTGGGPDPFSLTTPQFQATHEGTDYFLAFGRRDQGAGGQGYVYASDDGERTIRLEATYSIQDEPAEFSRANELRVGPDGTKYLVDHLNFGPEGKSWTSSVSVLEGGRLRLLGQTPPNLNVGVAGGNQFPFLSTDIDSAGNVHAAFRTGPSGTDNSIINVYYQLFPREAVEYQRAVLLTQPDCPACDAAREFLGAAGVAFQENATDLPPDLAGSIASETSSRGYPLLVRIGRESVVRGGADVPAISRLLGVSHPILVESHAPRGTATGGALALAPQWILMVVEDDEPRIVVDRRDGVVALAPGAWTATRVMDVPEAVRDTDRITFSKRYPAFPSSGDTLSWSTQRDVRFNTIDRVGDLVFLYHSAATTYPDWHGDPLTQFDYALWTTESAPTTSDYHAVQEVSQLIPAAAFHVALGANGKPGRVSGELGGYVTDESVVTDDGERFYRVVVDLRARGETATDGNIVGRVIAGQVSIDTETEDGTPETRDVALTLLVQNTRLRAFDPVTRALSRDITTEAVHFIGTDEHWQITNNIGLPNSLPCGPDQSLELDPFSVTTFNRADVAAWDIGSCLAAAEVAPTVLQDCQSLADLQLVLAAETMASLSTSLPVTRSEDETNWEVAYGTRSAAIHRIVALDPGPTGDGPACAGAGGAGSATSAVVRVSGTFIGSGEPYRPAVDIIDRGTTKVRTASLARPGDLAWEREYLELESAFLQANLGLTVGQEAVGTWFFLGGVRKRVDYARHLLATRALLHCNHQGVSVGGVTSLLERAAGVPGALEATARCLRDFVLHPTTYWQTYDPVIWASGANEVSWVGDVLNRAMAGNVTLAFLAAASAGQASDYGWFVIPRAEELGQIGAANNNPVATDYELDHYARLASVAARELGDVDGGLLRAYLLSGQLERTTMAAVIECARSMPGEAPLARLIELTSVRAYASGIPCVDAVAGQAARIERYRLLAIGLRSGTFGALLDAAGRDLDLVQSYFDRYLAVAAQATELERRYPGAAIDGWRADLPAADRMMLALRQMEAIARERGRQMTVADLAALAAGIEQCGIGLVKALPEGLLIMGALGAAAVAGPVASIAGGVLFLGFGLYTLDAGVRDLAEVWESLDLAGKTAGACGTAVGAVMTVAGAGPIKGGLRAFTPAEVQARPPTTIDTRTVPSRGRTAGLTLEEQGETLAPRGGSVRASAQIGPRPVDAVLLAAVNRLPAARRPGVLAAADRLGYERMTDLERGVFRELIADTGPGGQTPESARMIQMLSLQAQGKAATPEYAAWRDVGAAVIEELGKPAPKSFDVEVVAARPASGATPAQPARIAGSDAAILQAADDAGVPPTDLVFVDPEAVMSRQPRLLAAILDSERFLDALNEPAARPLFTPAEAQALYRRAQAARPSVDTSFFRVLASVELAEQLRAAVDELAGAGHARVASVAAEALDPGNNKVAVRVTLTLADGSIAELVVAKGAVPASEAATYGTYGPLEITQRLLAPLMEGVDGDQALLVTEYWPGRKVAPGIEGYLELSAATAEPAYAKALGALWTRLWFRTRDAAGTGEYNADLHHRNVNVRDGGALDAARVIDFSPSVAEGGHTVRVDESTAWVAELLRRAQGDEISTSVQNMDAYLDGVLEQATLEPGVGRAEGLQLLRRVSLDLLDPDVLARARAIQEFIADPTIATRASSILDAWLARQSQSSRIVPLRPAEGAVWELAAA